MNVFARILSLVPAEWLRRAAALQWRFPAMRKLYDLAARSLRNVDGVIARGAGRGLSFNAASTNAGYLLGTSEPAVQNALALLVRQGWTVFDLGANVGFLSMISGRLAGPSGRVVAFEPLPSNAEAIERNAALNGFRHVEVHTVAVGESAGESTFFVAEDAAWGTPPRSATAQWTWNAYVVAVPEESREFDDLLEWFRQRKFGTR